MAAQDLPTTSRLYKKYLANEERWVFIAKDEKFPMLL